MAGNIENIQWITWHDTDKHRETLEHIYMHILGKSRYFLRITVKHSVFQFICLPVQNMAYKKKSHKFRRFFKWVLPNKMSTIICSVIKLGIVSTYKPRACGRWRYPPPAARSSQTPPALCCSWRWRPRSARSMDARRWWECRGTPERSEDRSRPWNRPDRRAQTPHLTDGRNLMEGAGDIFKDYGKVWYRQELTK